MTLSAALRRSLSSRLQYAVQRLGPSREQTRRRIARVGLDPLVRHNRILRRLFSGPEDPRYRLIFDTSPIHVSTTSRFELHMLLCESDLVRGMWALKSFFLNAGIDARLTVHDDGSLSTESRRRIRDHFIGCEMPVADHPKVPEALKGYPLCEDFRRRHFIARKLFDVLVWSRTEYAMVIDSDLLWFAPSVTVANAIADRRPMYTEGGGEAYVRNRNYLEGHCGLVPASNVNSGWVGFSPADLRDLDFIERALDCMMRVPEKLVASSIGYRHSEGMADFDENDPLGSIVWWVMEQTLYALLMGREANLVPLAWDHGVGSRRHQFAPPIDEKTAFVHFISDARDNRFFPIGVDHLLRTDFLESWEKRSASSQSASSSGTSVFDQE